MSISIELQLSRTMAMVGSQSGMTAVSLQFTELDGSATDSAVLTIDDASELVEAIALVARTTHRR